MERICRCFQTTIRRKKDSTPSRSENLLEREENRENRLSSCICATHQYHTTSDHKIRGAGVRQDKGQEESQERGNCHHLLFTTLGRCHQIGRQRRMSAAKKKWQHIPVRKWQHLVIQAFLGSQVARKRTKHSCLPHEGCKKTVLLLAKMPQSSGELTWSVLNWESQEPSDLREKELWHQSKQK